MKKFYGDEAIRMMNAGTKEVKFVEIADDPWWGKKYEEKTFYKIDGKTYEETTDRDGWKILTEVEG